MLEHEVEGRGRRAVVVEPQADRLRRRRPRPRADVGTDGPFDVITMGRVGVDLYPEQSGVPLGGRADVREVARREPDERRRRRRPLRPSDGRDHEGRRRRLRRLRPRGAPWVRRRRPVRRRPTPSCGRRSCSASSCRRSRRRSCSTGSRSAPDMQVAPDELDLDAIRDARVFWTTGTGLSASRAGSATLAALEARVRGRSPCTTSTIARCSGRSPDEAGEPSSAGPSTVRDGRRGQRRGVRSRGGGRRCGDLARQAARPRAGARDREARRGRGAGVVGEEHRSGSCRCRSPS